MLPKAVVMQSINKQKAKPIKQVLGRIVENFVAAF